MVDITTLISPVDSQPGSLLEPDDFTFRRALGSFLTGVTIVTSRHAGENYGMTASSLASVSNDPPSLLVCLNAGSATRDAVRESRRFTVSVLADNQDEVAKVFARPNHTIDKFDQAHTSPGADGVHYVKDALANMECVLMNECAAGTHSILVGQIEGIRLADGEALAYFRGGFGSFVPGI